MDLLKADIAQILIALFTGGFLNYIASAIINRRKHAFDIKKTIADIESVEVNTALKLVSSLSKRVDTLENELKKERAERMSEKSDFEVLRSRVGVLTRGVYALVEQIKGMGQEPVFTLSSDDLLWQNIIDIEK